MEDQQAINCFFNYRTKRRTPNGPERTQLCNEQMISRLMGEPLLQQLHKQEQIFNQTKSVFVLCSFRPTVRLFSSEVIIDFLLVKSLLVFVINLNIIDILNLYCE